MRWSVMMLACLAGAGGRTAAAAEEPALAIKRRIPPPGIDVGDETRQQLQSKLEKLSAALAAIRAEKRAEDVRSLLPDIEIYEKAVRYALEHGEFYRKEEIKGAIGLLGQAEDRLKQLRSGRRPWARQTGLFVRGYTSAIDDSVQPYGLVIPKDFSFNKPTPLYVWLHGRGDTTTDLQFLLQRQTRAGTIEPANAIVLHPFGRYCNAFKFAGETDVFEAIEAVKREYNIDPRRIVLWGFSMGGAGAWHLGAHFPDRWIAVSPGAGFAETARYQNLKVDAVPAHERTLWRWYDAPGYVRNLFNVPLVAYSGELDKQIQAARVMEEAFASHGKSFEHIIGPKTEHKYHPQSLATVSSRIGEHVAAGQNPFPESLTFQTHTLRYSRCFWIEALGLGAHWQEARLDARRTGESIEVKTINVTALRLHPSRPSEAGYPKDFKVVIDGSTVLLSHPSPNIPLVRSDGGWEIRDTVGRGSLLEKRPGLQGPIDDAFCEPFLVVLPTGRCTHAKVQQWVDFEIEHQRDRWRRLFRGDVRIKRDVDVTENDWATYHLVLWGDPAANQVTKRVAKLLPIQWNETRIEVGSESFDASGHVVSMIFPNPLQQSPRKYVVLNSGPTFRAAHDRTNSQQTPKLPDWAIVDLSVPPNDVAAGRIVSAGFFDEAWRLKGAAEGQ